MGRIFYLTDPHFCHEGIIKSCGTPFPDAAPMTEAMLAARRAGCAKPNVLNVGADIAFSTGILSPAALEDRIRINEDWRADHPL